MKRQNGLVCGVGIFPQKLYDAMMNYEVFEND